MARGDLEGACEKGLLCVIKCVPSGLPGQLPNFRMTSIQELEVAIEKLANCSGDYVEAWLCRTPIGTETFMVNANRSATAATNSVRCHNRIAAIMVHTRRYAFRGTSRLAADRSSWWTCPASQDRWRLHFAR
ncbi:MAG: hypothetical protein WD157_00720 [Patescibacteria group bacterium]